MNYSIMTDLELLHYLDLYSNDPIVRRLVDLLGNTRGGIISDLEAAGMDPRTWTFGSDWESMYPGEYIESLRTDVRNAEEELSGLRYKYNDLEEECERLQTRTVMDFIKEVKQEQADNADLVREAMKTVKAFKDENERLKEQIDMWGRMNQVKQTV